eukprot:1448184-Amphidinium_carterae.1
MQAQMMISVQIFLRRPSWRSVRASPSPSQSQSGTFATIVSLKNNLATPIVSLYLHDEGVRSSCYRLSCSYRADM